MLHDLLMCERTPQYKVHVSLATAVQLSALGGQVSSAIAQD